MGLCESTISLVNLTCGRNPWKQACPSDETFRAYLSNPDFLRCILPISKQCNDLLKRIFALNPASRISIKELKAEVKRMGNWTMSLDELRHATRATKEAARAWAPSHVLDDPAYPDAPPPKAPQPAVAQQQQQQHQPRVKAPRETVFDITDSSVISSVDSLQEWKQHQQQQAHVDQQIKRQHAKQQYPSPYIPSPSTSPSLASSCFDPAAPIPTTLHRHAIAAKVAVSLHSDFSLSDSDETSSDEDDRMDYTHRNVPSYSAKPHPPQPMTPHEHATRSARTVPPPLSTQSPRTPRQLFAAATHRQRKQSVDSASSSSSASSDASWTGLPPTPDTPIFTKRPQEKTKSPMLSIGAGKMKLAF